MDEEQAINANEYEMAQWAELENARLMEGQNQQMAKTKKKSGFLKKLGDHWLILTFAIFFDILGLIPLLSIITNIIFGFVLFIYFKTRPNPPTESSFFIKQAMIILGGSIVDSFLSIIPVNLGAALTGIAQIKK